MKQWVATSVLAASLFGSACSRQAAKSTSDGAARRSFIKARVEPLVDFGEWEGVVRSSRRVELRAETQKRLLRVVATNLSRVKRQQLLIEVDSSEIEKKIRDAKDRVNSLVLDESSATISLRQRAKVLERRKVLFAKGVIPERELEVAERDVKLDRNSQESKSLELQKVRRELADLEAEFTTAHVYAPIDGVVTSLPSLEVTNDVQAGTLLATISDPEALSLWITVDEIQRPRIEVGQTATIVMDVGSEKLEGMVKEVALTPEPGDAPIKSYKVRFDLGKGAVAQEGFRGKARIEFGRSPSAVVVPLAALRTIEGRDVVAVSDRNDGQVRVVTVEVGIRTAVEAEIKSGINGDDFVVIDL